MCECSQVLSPLDNNLNQCQCGMNVTGENLVQPNGSASTWMYLPNCIALGHKVIKDYARSPEQEIHKNVTQLTGLDQVSDDPLTGSGSGSLPLD